MLATALFLFPKLSMDDDASRMAVPQSIFDSSINTSVSTVKADPDIDIKIAMASRRQWEQQAAEILRQQDYSLLLTRDDRVRLSALFGLDVKNIVIDPGHGGKDPGAIGAGGTREKDITLDVAQRLAKKLSAAGQNVILTRKTDSTLSLADRVDFAKTNNADLFISLHVNSLPNETLNIIETYYFGPPLTSDILKLAEQENKDSHYTLAELDTIIQDIENTLKLQESAILARSIQDSLFQNVKEQDGKVLDCGTKMAPFVVLSQIDVPSVLVEMSCITKKEEEKKLATASYRKKIATFIEEGIIQYLRTRNTKFTIGEK